MDFEQAQYRAQQMAAMQNAAFDHQQYTLRMLAANGLNVAPLSHPTRACEVSWCHAPHTTEDALCPHCRANVNSWVR